jgi:uncharacterized membrane protein YraQ (UPF0718 family)
VIDSIKSYLAIAAALLALAAGATLSFLFKDRKKKKAEIENLKRNARTEKIHNEIITDLDLMREKNVEKFNEMKAKQKIIYGEIKADEANENRDNRRFTDNIERLLNNPRDNKDS